MSEFIDRVAKAIGDDLYGYCDPKDTPNTWQVAVGAARAAVAAMREPSDGMFMRGSNAEPYNRKQNGRMRGRRIGDMPARDCWRLMIDAALEEQY